jgi:hypothetical protein
MMNQLFPVTCARQFFAAGRNLNDGCRHTLIPAPTSWEIIMRYAIAISTGLFAITMVASGQTGSDGKYCLNEYLVSPKANCSFRTLAQCEQSKTGINDSCELNPGYRPGTHGSGNR